MMVLELLTKCAVFSLGFAPSLFSGRPFSAATLPWHVSLRAAVLEPLQDCFEDQNHWSLPALSKHGTQSSDRSVPTVQPHGCGDPRMVCLQAAPYAPNVALSVCHYPYIQQWPSSR